jgi:hypothetical protein
LAAQQGFWASDPDCRIGSPEVDQNDQEALVNKPWIPLAGVLFLVLVIVGGIVGGEPPSADDPVQEIVDYYLDDKDSIMVGALIGAIGVFFFLVFASYLRNVVRAQEGEGGLLANVGFAGAIVLAVAAGIDGTILFALAETADDIEPTSVQTLQALWDNDFVPFVIGGGSFLLANGISIAISGALPKWLGWAAIVFGVVAFTPIGFVGFLGGALWILVASIVLALAARTPSASEPPAAPAPGV